MKKITFILALLTLALNLDAAISISREGGPSKYEKVVEKHSGWGWWSDHTLDCKGPGQIECSWMNPPIIFQGGVEHNISFNVIMTTVHQYVELGQNSGTVNISGLIVNWTGTSVEDYTIVIPD